MTFLRRCGLGASAALLAMVSGCAPETTAPAPEPVNTANATQAYTNTLGFDFDHGNAAFEVVIPAIAPLLSETVAMSDASILLYVITTQTASWFDAVAPYTPKAVGFYSNLPRRPVSERTNRNMNIAIMYGTYRTALAVMLPKFVPALRTMMTSVGLDPDNSSTNTTTAIGIGNVAGNSIVQKRWNDGMNHRGDESDRKYNLHPYEDTTGYEPFNTAYELKDPSRWQPDLFTTGNGIFRIQNYVTPQYANTDPFIVKNVKQLIQFPKPRSSDWQHNPDDYRAQANEILQFSANLNNTTKLEAELFNMKIISLGGVSAFAIQKYGLGIAESVQYDHMVLAAAFDAGIPVWVAKNKYDAVRPFSAIRFLNKNKKVTAWGGVGKGTVHDMPGREWAPYLQTADHTEYPSGSSCFCAAHAEASRRYFHSDDLGWTLPFSQGSSENEPGITPTTDTTLSYPTWSSFADHCGHSRMHGGVHFRSAVEEALDRCPAAGRAAYEEVMDHVNGTVHH